MISWGFADDVRFLLEDLKQALPGLATAVEAFAAATGMLLKKKTRVATPISEKLASASLEVVLSRFAEIDPRWEGTSAALTARYLGWPSGLNNSEMWAATQRTAETHVSVLSQRSLGTAAHLRASTSKWHPSSNQLRKLGPRRESGRNGRPRG